MDKPRPAAERVRPILLAMERSIDAARRRRLHIDDAPETVAPAPVPDTTGKTLPLDETVPRMKARPKRPSAFSTYDNGYRSQAG